MFRSLAFFSMFCKYLVFFCNFIVFCENRELLLSNVIHRHGDRSPTGTYVNNHFQPWPQGLGQLTKTGKVEAYELGKLLRSRYMSVLLNETYNVNEITVTSSDLDRTLMSAYCVLAGLYPPTADNRWDADINWQPIPVRNIPLSEDNKLHVNITQCSKALKILENLKHSSFWKEFEQQNQEFFNFLSQPDVTGQNVTADNVNLLSDILFCENAHNFTLPDWALSKWKGENQTVYEKLIFIYNWGLRLFHSPEIVRYTAGPLLQEIISNMFRKVKGNITQKLFIYSGHDITLAALLSLLGVFDYVNPPYSSAVIIELYRENDTYFVSVYYRNNTFTDAIIKLPLPMCSSSCSWDEFFNATGTLYPSNWKTECNLSVLSAEELILISSVGLSVLAAAVLVICIVYWCNRKPPGIVYSRIKQME